jgi:hypothetical protein
MLLSLIVGCLPGNGNDGKFAVGNVHHYASAGLGGAQASTSSAKMRLGEYANILGNTIILSNTHPLYKTFLLPSASTGWSNLHFLGKDATGRVCKYLFTCTFLQNLPVPFRADCSAYLQVQVQVQVSLSLQQILTNHHSYYLST